MRSFLSSLIASCVLLSVAAHSEDIPVGTSVTRNWSVCTQKSTAKGILDIYKKSLDNAYFTFEHLVEAGECAYIKEPLVLQQPIYAVRGVDGGYARVFPATSESGATFYWIQVQ